MLQRLENRCGRLAAKVIDSEVARLEVQPGLRITRPGERAVLAGHVHHLDVTRDESAPDAIFHVGVGGGLVRRIREQVSLVDTQPGDALEHLLGLGDAVGACEERADGLRREVAEGGAHDVGALSGGGLGGYKPGPGITR